MGGMDWGWTLIGQFAGLIALAWLVPQALARLMPEGMRWLVLNGAASAAILAGAAAGLFALAYGPAAREVWASAPLHFAGLAARSALIWAPVMVLSVANLPRGWRTRQW